MEEMRSGIESTDPPEGDPRRVPELFIVLHDPGGGERSLAIVFFESEDDYRRGDEILNAVPAGGAPGRHSSVTKYDVAIHMVP